MLFFGSCSGRPDFIAYVENLIGIFGGAQRPILETGMIDLETFSTTITNFRVWAQRPDAAFWYVMPWAEGIVSETRV